MNRIKSKLVGLVVAHPDDETLWAGGTVLNHPSWNWFTACLCRSSDSERARKFYQALKILNSNGIMGDLEDGPEQQPLNDSVVQQALLGVLPMKHFDLLISHNPSGEYTRHRRHEEVSRAVIRLWHAGKISTDELWTFAYEDGGKQYYPQPIKNTPIHQPLSKLTWQKKYQIITEVYGFEKDSFEAQTTPRREAFWQFTKSVEAVKWLNDGGHVL